MSRTAWVDALEPGDQLVELTTRLTAEVKRVIDVNGVRALAIELPGMTYIITTALVAERFGRAP